MPTQYEWATEEWFDEAVRSSHARMKPTPGADLITQHVITETPRGTVHYVEEKKDGRLRRLYLGECPTADLVVTLSYADYRRIFEELTTSDRMSTVKVEGNTRLLEPFKPIRRSEAFREHTKHMRAVTRWP